MENNLYTIEWHYDGIENYKMLNRVMFKSRLQELFVEGYNECCHLFNEHIDNINKEWDKLDKPCAFGEYIEDINPEYVNFIRERLHQRFINLNVDQMINHNSPLEFYIDDHGGISARLRAFPDVKMYFTMREAK